jgi:hypothetical protein
MMKTGFGGTWYSTLFGIPFAKFLYTVPKLYHPAKIMFLRGAAKCGQKIK